MNAKRYVRVKTRRVVMLAAVLFCLHHSWSPVHAASADEAPGMRGKLRMSDGAEVEGAISTPGSKPIVFYDVRQRKRLLVQLSELCRIDVQIEHEEMAEKWVWKEQGFHEKIYTGEKYPVRTFLLELEYPDGHKRRGHIVGTSLEVVNEKGEKERFKLVRKITGKVGQKLDDLVYVEQVTFAAEGEPKKAAGGAGSIVLKLKAGTDVAHAWVFEQSSDQLFEAKQVEGGFAAKNLPHGTYGVIVETENAFFVDLCEDAEQPKGLAPFNVGALEKLLSDIGDFFHSQRIIHWTKKGDLVKAIVLSERYGKTSLKGAELVRRYDLFVFRKVEDEWRVDKRLHLGRALYKTKKQPPRKRIVRLKPAKDMVVDAENRVVERDIALLIKHEKQP